MSDLISQPRSSEPLIAAHRGACRQEPQNSLAAFDAARDAGADMIEYDVRRMGDGTHVVNHDTTWQRMVLRDHGYGELHDAPPRAGRRRITGGKRPERLETVVNAYKGSLLHDIEIKEADDGIEVVGIVLALLPPSSFIVTSFHDQVVAETKRRHPEVMAGLLVSNPGRIFERGQRANADYLCPREALCTRRMTARAVELGIPLIVWTVNRDLRIRRFLDDPAIHTIITDVPDRATKLRSEQRN
jgi:glycerophosphoryl diester phosphodiesterase